MKSNANIIQAWDSHQFIGNNRSLGYVTVEKDWSLEKTSPITPVDESASWPTADRTGPWRFYQAQSGSITEQIDIPNVKSINIDRSIDTDAASCKISIYNSGAIAVNGTGWNQPGYFSYNRGESVDAQARWGHVPNEWSNVLVPMALIRTYQGFGNRSHTREEALEAGEVTITGTWFVDTVSLGTNGMLELSCRDAAKLLLDQLIFPPLIPSTMSPLKYFKWKDTTYTAIWDPGAALGPRGAESALPVTFATSSQDVLRYGTDAYSQTPLPVVNLGYPTSSVVDKSENIPSIGVGFVTNTRATALDWWEVFVNAEVNRVYVSPWGGGYTAYISVMVNGAWVADAGTIEYTPGTPAPGDITGDAAAGIGYVASGGVSFETPTTIELPQVYNAQRVRVTLVDAKLRGGFPVNDDTLYRTGMREMALGLSTVTSSPVSYAMARHYQDGYWVIGAGGQVFAFGTAPDPANTPAMVDTNPGVSTTTIGAEGHPFADGFWTVETNGKVHAFGASQLQVDGSNFHDGSHLGFNDFVDIACTPSGQGYWLLRTSGGVYTFGDAAYMSGTYLGGAVLGEIPVLSTGLNANSITGHPTDMGYWVVDAQGHVANFGAAVNWGEVTPPLPASGNVTAMDCTDDGGGYWILWSNGQVFNYGNADTPIGGGFIGSFGASVYPWSDIIRTNTPSISSPQGHWGLRVDSKVGLWGANSHGEPGGVGIIRTEGNYSDYVDIIKDLLGWAGFTLVEPTFEGPAIIGIHGLLESTGVYSEEALSEDIFDKKPVMDAIRTIKEVVGYITYIDEEGGFHFQAPNWWAPGNFYEDGTRVSYIPEIDEEKQLFEYSLVFSDESLRSEVIIANSLPTPDNKSTIVSRHVPPGQNILRGMVRPAIWANEVFNRKSEQDIMAELIGMHIWFSQREGSVNCVANPCIQINDQVRIWERTTAESYIHYVRGISTSHDLDTGEYLMSLTTHWLGSDTSWVISTASSSTTQNQYIGISPGLVSYLANTGSAAANPANFAGFTGV